MGQVSLARVVRPNPIFTGFGINREHPSFASADVLLQLGPLLRISGSGDDPGTVQLAGPTDVIKDEFSGPKNRISHLIRLQIHRKHPERAPDEIDVYNEIADGSLRSDIAGLAAAGRAADEDGLRAAELIFALGGSGVAGFAESFKVAAFEPLGLILSDRNDVMDFLGRRRVAAAFAAFTERMIGEVSFAKFLPGSVVAAFGRGWLIIIRLLLSLAAATVLFGLAIRAMSIRRVVRTAGRGAGGRRFGRHDNECRFS